MSQMRSLWSRRLFRVFFTIALLSLILAACCFALPILRKRSALTLTGERAVTELSVLCVALSHYSAGDLEALAASELEISPQYKDLSALLALVRQRGQYETLRIVAQNPADRSYRVIADADYRDNATPSTDYYAQGALYPTDVYRYGKAIMDSLFSQKAAALYPTDLVTLPSMRQVVTAYLPVHGIGNRVIAVLAADCNPGNTRYHIVGPLDLYAAGWLSAGVFALSAVIVLLLGRFARPRPAAGPAIPAAFTEAPAPEEPAPEPPEQEAQPDDDEEEHKEEP